MKLKVINYDPKIIKIKITLATQNMTTHEFLNKKKTIPKIFKCPFVLKIYTQKLEITLSESFAT